MSLVLGYFSPSRMKELGMVHDIGKIRIPISILDKSTDLNPFEKLIMQKHSDYGKEILDNLGEHQLAHFAGQHHEYLDGSGTNGISGDEIPLETRILTVADVFDALTTRRPYKRSVSENHAMQYIWSGSGIKFDNSAVLALDNVISHKLPYPAKDFIDRKAA